MSKNPQIPAIEDTIPRPFIFIVMPFRNELKNVHFAIKQAANAAEAYAERLDDRKYTENMLTRVYSQISASVILVADVTYENPNVYYELGYAHGINKIVLFTKRRTARKLKLPFDTDHYPHILYDPDDMASFTKELTEYMLVGLSKAQARTSSMRPANLEMYVNGLSDRTRITDERLTYTVGKYGRRQEQTHEYNLRSKVSLPIIIKNVGLVSAGPFSDFYLQLAPNSSGPQIVVDTLIGPGGDGKRFTRTLDLTAKDGFTEHWSAPYLVGYLKPNLFLTLTINFTISSFDVDVLVPVRIGFYIEDQQYLYEFDLRVEVPFTLDQLGLAPGTELPKD